MSGTASCPWSTAAAGWIVTSAESAHRRGPGPCILCPILAGLGPQLSDIAAVLPVGDANGLILSELEKEPTQAAHVVAGVLANDPFRSQERLLTALRERGMRAVANWPSLGLISGELGQALTHSGFTFQAEVDLLRRARMMGFATVAFASGAAQVQQALAAEPSMIVLAPPLSAASEQDRRAAACETASLFTALAARSDVPELRLYLPERLNGLLDDTALKEGQLVRFAGEAA